MMNDQGRTLSNFKTSNKINEEIRFLNGIYRDDEYRLFLQNNAKKIAFQEFQNYRAANFNTCLPSDCVHNYPTSPMSMDFITERLAYDSIFDPKTNAQYKYLRQCKTYQDYTLNPDC
jgi:hypothetical protein